MVYGKDWYEIMLDSLSWKIDVFFKRIFKIYNQYAIVTMTIFQSLLFT